MKEIDMQKEYLRKEEEMQRQFKRKEDLVINKQNELHSLKLVEKAALFLLTKNFFFSYLIRRLPFCKKRERGWSERKLT
jgi:hypothetical protein